MFAASVTDRWWQQRDACRSVQTESNSLILTFIPQPDYDLKTPTNHSFYSSIKQEVLEWLNQSGVL